MKIRAPAPPASAWLPGDASLTIVRSSRRHGRRPPLRIVPATALLFALGCANPGPPKPPSLHLPAPVKDLRAERVGSEVQLSWTTSTETTDDLPVKPPVTAEICRDQASAAHQASPPCTSVLRVSVNPGASSAVDPLPAPLRADPVTPLIYRVRLLNARGRSADPSDPAIAASGQAPEPLAGLSATLAAAGVRLEWQPSPTPATSVLLLRFAADTGSAPHPKRSGLGRKSSGNAAEPVHLLASAQGKDATAVLDTSGHPATRYTYIAWRERTVFFQGKPLVLRGAPSAPVSLDLRDIAPPHSPMDLHAVSFGFTVDLSWEPNIEPDLAGYLVERAREPLTERNKEDPAPWQQVSPNLIPSPGFHDQLPETPARYRYRIIAVDTAGNRSAPGEEVTIEVHADPAHP